MSDTTLETATDLPNRSAEGLFYAACEAATEASKAGLRHTERLLQALQSTMELVEFGKERPADVEALLHHHKSRQGVDIFGRLVKVVFPHASPPLQNCYANALRHVERHGKAAKELPAFLREVRIEKAARLEVKARRCGNAALATPAAPTRPLVVPEGYQLVPEAALLDLSSQIKAITAAIEAHLATPPAPATP